MPGGLREWVGWVVAGSRSLADQVLLRKFDVTIEAN